MTPVGAITQAHMYRLNGDPGLETDVRQALGPDLGPTATLYVVLQMDILNTIIEPCFLLAVWDTRFRPEAVYRVYELIGLDDDHWFLGSMSTMRLPMLVRISVRSEMADTPEWVSAA